MGINQLAQQIHAIAKEKGFYDKPVNVAEKLMLIVTEIAEACEADRKNLYAQNPILDIYDTNLEHFNVRFETYIKDSFEDELADAIIRILDLCAYLNIDIQKFIGLKMRYNATRPNMHGKEY